MLITLYTDGACLGNPGPGGWAGLLSYGDHVKEYAGGELNTTNNRMELMAAIEGLRLIKSSSRVVIYTDSQYLRMGITQWINKWMRMGWVKSDKKPVKNVDLWKALHDQTLRHDIEWQWVKAHSGIEQNERVDQLARAQAIKLSQGSHT